ncbi:MAG: ABC transporter substrate-binding protein, partial [Candidatus Eremiobacteraeota bacterium]|nr:ABC transporter substrate-binding protein [Candidatus Eremiobacteraeota bacterium]
MAGIMKPPLPHRQSSVHRRTFLASLAALPAALRFAPARAAEPTLQIGYVPSTLFAPVFVAADRGYFNANGLTPNLTPIVAGQDAMALLATGGLDMV